MIVERCHWLLLLLRNIQLQWLQAALMNERTSRPTVAAWNHAAATTAHTATHHTAERKGGGGGLSGERLIESRVGGQ